MNFEEMTPREKLEYLHFLAEDGKRGELRAIKNVGPAKGKEKPKSKRYDFGSN